jgi:hypothetical protein
MPSQTAAKTNYLKPQFSHTKRYYYTSKRANSFDGHMEPATAGEAGQTFTNTPYTLLCAKLKPESCKRVDL